MGLCDISMQQCMPGSCRAGHPLHGPPAARRDCTINSMFFNINTRQVEDFTRRGLDDLLHNRIIRTPLPAMDTFQDGECCACLPSLQRLNVLYVCVLPAESGLQIRVSNGREVRKCLATSC